MYEQISIALLAVVFSAVAGFIVGRRERQMPVDLSAQFAKLDASIAALPARVAAAVAAGQAGSVPLADVQAAADSRAAAVDAIAPAPTPVS